MAHVAAPDPFGWLLQVLRQDFPPDVREIGIDPSKRGRSYRPLWISITSPLARSFGSSGTKPSFVEARAELLLIDAHVPDSTPATDDDRTRMK
jgi:hypothetical protein